MLSRLFAIASKEVRQLRRDRLTFGMIIGVPLLQILLFGFAIDLDVRNVNAAVSDHANTSLSRQVIAATEASQIVKITQSAAGPEELEALLDAGEIDVGIYIPHDFERRLIDGNRPAGQLLINGSDPTVEGIVRRLGSMPLPGQRQPPNLFESRTYYNPEGRSPVNIVPALIGVILHLTMVLFTAIAIVRERERGNLELLITTPVKSAELMLGKIVPYVLIGLIQVTLILWVSQYLFDVPVRGRVIDLYLASVIFILATLALGLFVSTLAKTQFQATQLTIFTFLPSILLSGFMFPFDGMPRLAQWIGEVIPLTHYIRLSRGILLRGADLSQLHSEIWPLLAFFGVFLVLATLRFNKQLD
ncbi:MULTISPECIES: ABC transporter permease [Salinivibrio]|uniref:Transport permease protein n=1 Tax=Salinivibrio kushneri TaxID=1908198 RepID=A0AB36K1N7_9GAMM|nr:MULTISPECIES: ABC transporter permease [Salinivibrio]OOE40755.1 ABC transporter [Salinivibrio kushneri]OOE55372.1 ABC transporter [Salinivibrio kushneri]OOE67538.1 ABC transporter [Salinivibrio sp. IB868]OOE71185.1 ABC transporter [Salinivibrio sp. IB870]QCP03562.1 ABC transporter permease [Salinivibrio kushneri]